jgi:trans-aconitate methyltransferase
MDDDSEVEAYAGAAAQAYLEAIDRSFLRHVEGLMPSPRIDTASVLDVGCGPGQILVMMKQRWPDMQITGLDAGPAMIEKARRDAEDAGLDIAYEVLRVGPQGDARLPFDDASFDIVTCNSRRVFDSPRWPETVRRNRAKELTAPREVYECKLRHAGGSDLM